MAFLVPLLATFVLLVGSSVLLATVGRRRRRHRAIEQSTARAIEGVVGSKLADLVTEAIRVRRLIEDAAASGREMLAIEVQLGSALRRPLWRQIEEANFGHELDRVRRETGAWLVRFDRLDAADQQIINLLDLDVGPVRALAAAELQYWDNLAGVAAVVGDHVDELRAMLQRAVAAIDCLLRIERELIDYRPGGYR